MSLVQIPKDMGISTLENRVYVDINILAWKQELIFWVHLLKSWKPIFSTQII